MGTLFFIGLGLYDITDISVKGLEVAKTAKNVFVEFYTSSLQGSTLQGIRDFLGREITLLTREEVESESILIDSSLKGDTVLLTAGDPLSATTHQSLRIEALKRDIPVRIIHSSSIFTAVPGLLGLHSYKFGRTTTMVRPKSDYFPLSPYEVIAENLEMGLHTLVLLDIKEEEGYSMTANEAMRLLMEMESQVKKNIIKSGTKVAVVARAGSNDPLLWYGTIKQGLQSDFGHTLHTLVVPGVCHFMEQEMLDLLGTTI